MSWPLRPLGRSAATPAAPSLRSVGIEDLRRGARRRLPRFVWDYLEGAAEDGRSHENNLAAFARLRWRPRVLRDVSRRALGCTLLGQAAALPLVVGPTGLAGFCWPQGDLALARAAARAGAVFALSTVSSCSIEDVARQVEGRLWFQLYVFRERAISERLLARARDAGYEALILTCDLAVQGKRECDWRNGFRDSGQPNLAARLEALRHPRWLWNVLRRRPGFANLDGELPAGIDPKVYVPSQTDPSLDWDYFQRLRALWPRKLLLKGVLRAEDAERAVALGADAVVLSNHGGRQLDSAISALDALPEVRRALGDRAQILVDGGVRRGGDLLKARALGADAVIAGRAPLYGLASAGEPGAAAAIEVLREEADRTLALLGCASLDELDAGFVVL